MPKASKKRKDKAADFAKAKLKLGKGKQLPSNAIDTSFKAKSIALPAQRIGAERDVDVPTTKRKLSFDDLLSHLKHYNANTRRDAILGMRELCNAHPELVEPNLTALLNACVRLIGDEDASVRKTLLQYLSELLPKISVDNIQPHCPTLLLFTTSAQTHIFPEIRVDAIRFLNLFLNIIPETVVAGWTEQDSVQGHSHGSRVLEGYLGILNAGTSYGQDWDTGPVKATSTASVTLSAASKFVVLDSLATFLKHALVSDKTSAAEDSRNGSSPIPSWFMASSFTTPDAFSAFDSALLPSSSLGSKGRRWLEQVGADTVDEAPLDFYPLARAPLGDEINLQELSHLVVVSATTNDVRTSVAARIARALYSTVLATLLDCAPLVFSPAGNPQEVSVKTMLATVRIVYHLYGYLLKHMSEDAEGHSQVLNELDALLRRMSAYLPFEPSGRQDVQTEQAFQDLNLIFCELTSLLLLSPSTSDKQPQRSSSSGLRRVAPYIVRLLDGTPTSRSGLSRPVSAQAYTALLPSIWALANAAISSPPIEEDDDEEDDADVLQATLQHALRAPSTSAVKRASAEFVGRLLLLDTERQYHGPLRLAEASEWILHLPKTLWELGGRDPSTSEVIIRVLLTLAQRRARCLTSEVSTGLLVRLVPFFMVTHATRGQLPGPYSKLPPALRRLMLDTVSTLQDMSGGDGAGATQAVVSATTGTEEAAYWANIRLAITV